MYCNYTNPFWKTETCNCKNVLQLPEFQIPHLNLTNTRNNENNNNTLPMNQPINIYQFGYIDLNNNNNNFNKQTSPVSHISTVSPFPSALYTSITSIKRKLEKSNQKQQIYMPKNILTNYNNIIK